MTLLSIEHISRSVETGFIRKQKKEILHDISFCVGKGKLWALQGQAAQGNPRWRESSWVCFVKTAGTLSFREKN